MRKSFLNTLYALCGLYIFGIVGSLEIGRLTLHQGMNHITAALIFTAVIYVILHLAIILRALYIRHRLIKRRRKVNLYYRGAASAAA